MTASLDVELADAGLVFDVEVAGPVSSLDLAPSGRPGRDGEDGSPGEPGPPGPPARLTRDWARDGLAGIAGRDYISSEVWPIPGGPHTLSVAGDSLRVNSTSAHTDNNVREVLYLSDSEYDDVEVLARIDAPSRIGDGLTPQPGIALRCGRDANGDLCLINVDVNIYQVYGPIWTGTWMGHIGPDGKPGLTQGVQQAMDIPVRMDTVTATAREWSLKPGSDVFFTANPSIFKTGDVVTATVFSDGSYDQANVPVDAGLAGYGAVEVPLSGDATPVEAQHGVLRLSDAGTYPSGTFQVRKHYPFMVRARIVQDTLYARAWLVGLPEPTQWQSVLELSVDPYLLPKGKIGLIANHLRGADNYLAYGPVEITPLTPLA